MSFLRDFTWDESRRAIKPTKIFTAIRFNSLGVVEHLARRRSPHRSSNWSRMSFCSSSHTSSKPPSGLGRAFVSPTQCVASRHVTCPGARGVIECSLISVVQGVRENDLERDWVDSSDEGSRHPARPGGALFMDGRRGVLSSFFYFGRLTETQPEQPRECRNDQDGEAHQGLTSQRQAKTI